MDFEHGEKIGKIIEAKVTPEGLWVKGRVFYKSPLAKMIFSTMDKQLPFDNQIKFSVEIEDPIYSQSDTSIIIGGKLYAVAIIGFNKKAANDYTFAELLKSLNNSWLESEILARAEEDPIFKLEALLSLIEDS